MDIFYPVKLFADKITYGFLRLSAQSRLAEVVDFFIYDVTKIFILLAVIIYTGSLARTFFPPDKVRRILSQKHAYSGNILAALFGIITPFCTCSAIPLFLGFVEAGVPLGVTFTFLVASPMINEVALVMLAGMFGWKIALIYISSGMVVAIFSGVIIGRLNPQGLLEQFHSDKDFFARMSGVRFNFRDRLDFAKVYTADIIKRIWPFVVLGIGVGAWIHGYIPQDLLVRYAGKGNWFSVPLATLIGIPLYSNSAGVIPLVSALMEKGVGLGTALAFMMAVTGLSLPEFLILRKVMKTRLILMFAGIVGLGIMFTGYLFDFLIK